MHQKNFLLLLFLFTILSNSFGQTDSTALTQEALSELDLFPHKIEKKNNQVISLFGKEEAIKDLPYTAYVITKEEIRENGYVTLTDALQTIPGIFVSPLGSAMEGELFTMSGLRGNRYTEIMINGMSIKPQASPGMPLGAQIPVRQAERIEVIYGPGKANIGYGANAGIINIVMKDSERPVFTQADVSIGGNGYNSLDIMFGGKLGRGKKLVKFSAWASSTSFNDWNIGFPTDSTIVSDRDVFQSSNYSVYNNTGFNYFPYYPYQTNTISAQYQTNYIGSKETAEKDNFPHVSRQLGMRLQRKRLELWMDNRYRRDHSALGMSPTSVSYSFRDDFTSETMNRIGVKIKEGNRNKKLKYSADFSLLHYSLDPRSSSRPIFNYANYGLLYSQYSRLEEEGVPLRQNSIDSLVMINQDEFLLGKKFRHAFATSWKMNNQLSYQIFDNWKATINFGFSLEGFNLDSYRDLYRKPVPISNELTRITSRDELPPNRFFKKEFNYTGNSFSYLSIGNDFYFSKIKGYAGLNITRTIDVQLFLPRLFLSYRLNDKSNIYCNFTRTFNEISAYQRANTFSFGNVGSFDFSFPDIAIFSYPNNLNLREVITSRVELGYRLDLDENRYISGNIFAANTQNVIRFRHWEDVHVIGYLNSQKDFMRLAGLQGLINLRKEFVKNTINLRLAFQMYLSEESFDNNGTTIEGGNIIEDYPRSQFQIRFFYKFKEKWLISTESFIRGGLSSGRYKRYGGTDNNYYFTTGNNGSQPIHLLLDIMARYKLSRNFALYFKVQNLFNSHYAGITASETPDALSYNVQPLRRFRIGINYDLE